MVRELLAKKIDEVKIDFISSFETWAVTRKIFDVSHNNKFISKVNENEFVRIGLSHIIEREWFTKPTGTIYYDHKTMGGNYGKSIAFGETKYILSELNGHKQNMFYIETHEVIKTINEIIDKKPHNDLVILTNPVSITQLIGHDNYKIIMKAPLWGYYSDTMIPIYFTPEIQHGVIYIFNKNVGSILIKEDANITVSEIKISEHEKIKADISELKEKNLLEYVRVRPFELIKYIHNEKIVVDVLEVDLVEE